MKESKCARAFGIRRRVERGDPTPLVRGENYRVLRADGIKDGAQILHPSLERCKLAAVIRKTGTALVEEDESKGTSKPNVEIAPAWILPPVHEVRHEVRHIDEVDVTMPTTWYAIATPPLRT